jgi:hypothetical protein
MDKDYKRNGSFEREFAGMYWDTFNLIAPYEYLFNCMLQDIKDTANLHIFMTLRIPCFYFSNIACLLIFDTKLCLL